MWESSPKTYKRIYIDGHKFPINRGMALGKEIADSLETGEETGNLMRDLIVSRFPKLDIMEQELKATIKIGKIEIKLFGKADTAKKDLSEFKEYKTGKTKWTQKQVDTNGQITLYATIIYALTGRIPKNIELVHALTETLPDGRFEFTGDIIRHPTIRTLKDIIKMKVRIKKAWEGIGRMCEDEFI